VLDRACKCVPDILNQFKELRCEPLDTLAFKLVGLKADDQALDMVTQRDVQNRFACAGNFSDSRMQFSTDLVIGMTSKGMLSGCGRNL